MILYRIDDAKRMYRFYRLDVQPDLFGRWCMVRAWGRVGTRGRWLSVPFAMHAEALAALIALRQVKQLRGYVYVEAL